MALLTNTPRGRFRKEISGTMEEREEEREGLQNGKLCDLLLSPMALHLCFYTSVVVLPRQPKM